jgi:predicted RNA-binding Zn-ribbon protein involved in translation (DUF1610 family)
VIRSARNRQFLLLLIVVGIVAGLGFLFISVEIALLVWILVVLAQFLFRCPDCGWLTVLHGRPYYFNARLLIEKDCPKCGFTYE